MERERYRQRFFNMSIIVLTKKTRNLYVARLRHFGQGLINVLKNYLNSEREREREGEREREREREKEREQGREINILNDYPGDRSGGGGPAIRLQLDCRLPRQEKTTH